MHKFILILFLFFASVDTALHPAKAAPVLTTSVLLAQADPNAAIDSFKLLLAKFCLLIGVAVIAYGGYLIARQGHTIEGVLCIIGGFIIAIAVPLITYLAQNVGITF
ncbi:MAG: hypothetical protein C5B50_05460 [Verrucomicrobia bacterium]|nr:MAG: hypothetical protein C5B50_05460 [Verrucomicrobiota bacterium]